MSERPRDFLGTLTSGQRKFLKEIVSFEVKKINWDLDQVLAASEEPLLKWFDLLHGTNFRFEKIKSGWDPVTEMAAKHFQTNLAQVSEWENELWTDPDVLFAAEPNYGIRRFSWLASHTGVVQTVATSRNSHFKDSTPEWLAKYYPWIDKGNIYQNKDTNMDGSDFKLKTILGLQPDVHVEDSI